MLNALYCYGLRDKSVPFQSQITVYWIPTETYFELAMPFDWATSSGKGLQKFARDHGSIGESVSALVVFRYVFV